MIHEEEGMDLRGQNRVTKQTKSPVVTVHHNMMIKRKQRRMNEDFPSSYFPPPPLPSPSYHDKTKRDFIPFDPPEPMASLYLLMRQYL